MVNTMTYRNPNEAFDAAVTNGTLTANEHAWNFAGHFMYMFSDKAGDHFKHIETRRYTVSK